MIEKKRYLKIHREEGQCSQCKKSLKIPKRSAAINLKTDNTMDKRKKTKIKTMIYKTLHRKLRIEEHEPH